LALVQSYPGGKPFYIGRYWWWYCLFFVATLIATLAFFYFQHFPAYRSWLVAIAPRATLLALISGLLLPLLALIRSSHGTIGGAKVHAALCAAFLIIALASAGHRHASPAGGLEVLVEVFLLAAFGIELLILGIAVHKADYLKQKPVFAPWIFTSLLAAVLVGWAFGVVAWAIQIPYKAIPEAEQIAQGRPYCIDVSGRAARHIGDPTGVAMLSRDSSGWASNFHGVLVIEQGSDRIYYNWSYQKRGFQPVSDRARIDLGIGTTTPIRCKPVTHFARGWL
jgi:hypothetical protein